MGTDGDCRGVCVLDYISYDGVFAQEDERAEYNRDNTK